MSSIISPTPPHTHKRTRTHTHDHIHSHIHIQHQDYSYSLTQTDTDSHPAASTSHVDVHADRLKLVGVGALPSRTIPVNPFDPPDRVWQVNPHPTGDELNMYGEGTPLV